MVAKQQRLFAEEEAEALGIENAVNKILDLPQVTTIEGMDNKEAIINGTDRPLTVTINAGNQRVSVTNDNGKLSLDLKNIHVEEVNGIIGRFSSLDSSCAIVQELSAPNANIDKANIRFLNIGIDGDNSAEIRMPSIKLRPVYEHDVIPEPGKIIYDISSDCFKGYSKGRWIVLGG